MTTTTVLIKRNVDKNYDKLFGMIEAATIMGRAASESERETPEGYAVTFKHLDLDVIMWVEGRSKDFAVQYDA
jgi:hypothetical protein